MGLRVIQSVFEKSKAKDNDRVVMLAIAYHANDETGECFPGIARLMKFCNVSRRTIVRALKVLSDLNELKITDRGSKTNNYDVLLHPKTSKSESKEATLLLADFRITNELREELEEQYPSLGIDEALREFIEHHKKKGYRSDNWPMKFRHWMQRRKAFADQSSENRQARKATNYFKDNRKDKDKERISSDEYAKLLNDF